MIIDCESCALSPSRTGSRAACDDCVVSVLLGPPMAESLTSIADEHERALGVLADSGLIPPLRLVRPPQAS